MEKLWFDLKTFNKKSPDFRLKPLGFIIYVMQGILMKPPSRTFGMKGDENMYSQTKLHILGYLDKWIIGLILLFQAIWLNIIQESCIKICVHPVRQFYLVR